MTIRRIGRDPEYDLSEYIGESIDTKPTDCKAGSTFLETDTGRLFIFDGLEWKEL